MGQQRLSAATRLAQLIQDSIRKARGNRAGILRHLAAGVAVTFVTGELRIVRGAQAARFFVGQ